MVFASMAREVPCKALSVLDSVGRSSEMTSPSFTTLMRSWTVKDSLPLGPSAETVWPWMLILTPAGTLMGDLPTLDIKYPLPDLAQDFAADALSAALVIREDTLGSGDDGDAEAVFDLGQAVEAGVVTTAGRAHAHQTLDRGHTVRVTEKDFHPALLVVGHDDEFLDEVLLDQNLRDFAAQLGRRHFHHPLADHCGVADARKHIADRIVD